MGKKGGLFKGYSGSLGAELMYGNISFNYDVDCVNSCDDSPIMNSLGMKVYNSGDDSKHKIFVGMFNTSGQNKGGINHFCGFKLSGGYRYTANSGIYLSPYAGISHILVFSEGNYYGIALNGVPCLGLNIGYQFKRK